MVKKISREEEDKLPDFSSGSEAESYFKNLYGDNFEYATSINVSGRNIRFFHLILNRDAYEKGMRELRENSYSLGMDLINSYQSIEIDDEGHVHVIH